jgi:hypothetical protein
MLLQQLLLLEAVEKQSAAVLKTSLNYFVAHLLHTMLQWHCTALRCR